MQLSNLFTVFALAMTATALPVVEDVDNILAERHNDGDVHTYICCNPAGRNCRGLDDKCPPPFQTYCCKTGDVTPVSSPSVRRPSTQPALTLAAFETVSPLTKCVRACV